MRQVFTAKHPMEAHFVKGLLEAEGIACEVVGEALFQQRGGVPMTPDTLPTVWVKEEKQVEEALRRVQAYERGDDARVDRGKHWVCKVCGEKVESQFTECWHCRTRRSKGN